MGSTPAFFRCPIARDTLVNVRTEHMVGLTGRTKKRRRGAGSRRTSDTDREYVCSCGHVGWSTHIDLERFALMEHPPKRGWTAS